MRKPQQIFSWFSHLSKAVPDPIFAVTDAFNKDTRPLKVNLGVGALMDDDYKPYLLPSVAKATNRVREKGLDDNHEYLPVTGRPEFCEQSIKLALGDDCPQIGEGLTTTIQTVGGTGALGLGAKFLQKFFPYSNEVFLPVPYWGNYNNIFLLTGLKMKFCRFYNPEIRSLDFEGFLEDVYRIPERSIILLQPCGQNPTGLDPKVEQWQELSSVIKKRKLFPFFDMAYQGLATGDLLRDSLPVRMFLEDGHQMALSQSYSKNMGLYGDRVGAFSLVNSTKEESEVTSSQVSSLAKGSYGSPPVQGARIVVEILGNDSLRSQWQNEVKNMANRIKSMRRALRGGLEEKGSTKDWSIITDQTGMFCYTGLKPEEVKVLMKEFSIYLPLDGRVSMGGVNKKNVDYIAHCIYKVTRKSYDSQACTVSLR